MNFIKEGYKRNRIWTHGFIDGVAAVAVSRAVGSKNYKTAAAIFIATLVHMYYEPLESKKKD